MIVGYRSKGNECYNDAQGMQKIQTVRGFLDVFYDELPVLSPGGW